MWYIVIYDTMYAHISMIYEDISAYIRIYEKIHLENTSYITIYVTIYDDV